MTYICQPTLRNNMKICFDAVVLTFHNRRQCQFSTAMQQRHAKTQFSAVGATRFVSIPSPLLCFKQSFKTGATPVFHGQNKACLHHRQALFGIETSRISPQKKPYSGFATGLPTVFSCLFTLETGVICHRKLLDLQFPSSKYFTKKPVILTISVR